MGSRCNPGRDFIPPRWVSSPAVMQKIAMNARSYLTGQKLVRHHYLRLEDLAYDVEYHNQLREVGPSEKVAQIALRVVWKNMIRPVAP